MLDLHVFHSSTGGNQPAGTRVLFTNGQIDPWHYESVLTSISNLEPAIWVPGVSLSLGRCCATHTMYSGITPLLDTPAAAHRLDIYPGGASKAGAGRGGVAEHTIRRLSNGRFPLLRPLCLNAQPALTPPLRARMAPCIVLGIVLAAVLAASEARGMGKSRVKADWNYDEEMAKALADPVTHWWVLLCVWRMMCVADCGMQVSGAACGSLRCSEHADVVSALLCQRLVLRRARPGVPFHRRGSITGA